MVIVAAARRTPTAGRARRAREWPRFAREQPRRFAPREWALAHIGYQRATAKLNDFIKSFAIAKGEPWTTDIVPKMNRPNLRYARDADREELSPHYGHLAGYLRGTGLE